MDDDDRPRPKGDAAGRLSTEDLAPYSQDELAERIALLHAEVDRVERHLAKVAAHRDAADALFGKPPQGSPIAPRNLWRQSHIAVSR